MKARISHYRFGECRGVLLVIIVGVMAVDALPSDRLYYRNDQFHYGLTIPKGWELVGDDFREAMNKNNQAYGLPRLDAVVRSLNVTSGLPVWIEIQRAKPIESGGFETYVRDIESVDGLSSQKMAEQVDKQTDNRKLKELARAAAGFRLIKVDRKSWRLLTEMEQPDLGYRILAATCFGNYVTVKIVYRAPPNVFFSEHHSDFSSMVESLAFDPGHQYDPKAHSSPTPRLTLRRSLELLEKLTTPVGLLLVLLLIVVWRGAMRRKVPSLRRKRGSFWKAEDGTDE